MARTGDNLLTTSRYLEQGLAWAGQKTKEGEKAVIQEARALARKLKKGTGRVAAEVGKGLKGMQKEIDALDKKATAE